MNTSATPCALSQLPPEIFHSISLCIPLNAVAPTLFALSLVDRHINNKIGNLIFSRIVLRNEDVASAVFEKIHASHNIGRTVREIYVLSERSPAAMAEGMSVRRFKFLGGLKDTVSEGLLPNLITLGVFKHSRSVSDRIPKQHKRAYSLPVSFWEILSVKAPQLRTVVIRDLAGDFASPWVDGELIEKTALRQVSDPYYA